MSATRAGRTRVPAALAGALCLLLLLTGCISIPRSGPIGQIDVDSSEPGQVRIDPDGPVTGASQDQIVRGFLAAGTGSASNFAVARSFLTDDLAASWEPLESVWVLKSGHSLDSINSEVTSDSQTVSLTLPVQAHIDSTRVYREAAADSERTVKFTLRQVNGEWRISKMPAGIVVTPANFSSMFQAHSLYYYTPDFKYAVPDTRWYLRSGSAGRELVADLLAGPADYLKGAVVPAVGSGRGKLGVGSLSVSDGDAAVELSGDPQLSARDAERLAKTVALSLQSMPSVRDVTVTGAGMPEDVDTANLPNTEVEVPGRPVVLQDGRLVELGGDRTSSLPLPAPKKGAGNPARDYTGRVFAYLAAGERELHRMTVGGRKDTVVVRGSSLAAPSFDRFGWLYTAESDTGRLKVVGPDGEMKTLKAGFLSKRTVTAVRVSRDGSRLVVLSTGSKADSRLDYIGIVRDSDQAPRELSGDAPLSAGESFSDLRDVSWAGTDTLVALAALESGGDLQPYTLSSSGMFAARGSVSEGTSISAGTDLRSMRIGTRAGDVYSYQGGAWQKLVGIKSYEPAFPG
ncbi:LpqB family beta-propeller domain-containing protein [Brevibacterium sp. 91QC2O2]|uniref:LpqB family beta-propeller domain-containing protein n=1 Tax=Brevibacterium TaxID=1696 RepID=UPI00211C463D|nr:MULTISPECIES: LpqB family beta-propeller domain-containing protein [unclassified Brevibacterium]MCQ9368490.1 LpqB family beta-propeller domain-containing protein [Brevibacterium sp. 91QC2O2]MCQ9385930.1 LpqB family beta-propeller domain-containing protein [Brevibacterium sp. 68QC2CO]